MCDEDYDKFEKLDTRAIARIAAGGLVGGNVGAAVLNMFGAMERDICEFGVPLGQIAVLAQLKHPEMLNDDPDAVVLRFNIDPEASWVGVPEIVQQLVLARVNEIWKDFIDQTYELLNEDTYPDDWSVRFTRFKLGFAAASYIRSWGRHFGDGRCGPVNQTKAKPIDIWRTMTNEHELGRIFQDDPRLTEFIHFNLHDEWLDED